MSTPNQNGSSNDYDGDRRLKINPSRDHRCEKYDDIKSDFDPAIFAALEKHLPSSMLDKPRDAKVEFMKEILERYLPVGEKARVQKHKEYRQNILSSYQPLHKELYNFNAAEFLEPSFVNAISGNTVDNFRSIISEPSSGVYTFAMFKPSFCELLLAEVEHFENWVTATKFKTMKPNTMNKHGAVLDDFGFESMLNKFMEEYICPLSRVFLPEVGGSTLDSHHGFVVEYGSDKDVELGIPPALCRLILSLSCLYRCSSLNAKVEKLTVLMKNARLPGNCEQKKAQDQHICQDVKSAVPVCFFMESPTSAASLMYQCFLTLLVSMLMIQKLL